MKSTDSGPYAERIRRLVEAAPPLSDTQRSRLATILRPSLTGRRPAQGGPLAQSGEAA